jgi:hypothetical protein
MSIKSNSSGTIPVKPPFGFIQIKIEWEDGISAGGKSFYNVQELAAFLDENPAFAQALKYVSKKARR